MFKSHSFLALAFVGVMAGCSSNVGTTQGALQSCFSTKSGLACMATPNGVETQPRDMDHDGQDDDFFCAQRVSTTTGTGSAASDDGSGGGSGSDDGAAEPTETDRDGDGIEDQEECDRCNRGPGVAGDFRFEISGTFAELDRGRVDAVNGSSLTVSAPQSVTINGVITSTVTIVTNSSTRVQGTIAAGAEIRAQGTLQADGTILASELEVLCPAL
jgi:uncharacterized protein DUF5666